MNDDTTNTIPVQPTESRAMNVDMAHADVVKLCAKHDAAISAIEGLVSGGTHVVFKNITDARTLRAAFGRKLIDGKVSRTRWVRNH